MFRTPITTALLALALLAAPAAHSDTLLVDRAATKPAEAIPARGQSMDQVRARFGEPSQQLDPRGGQKRQWPTIHRWVYPQFVVYFERSRVIDVVATQAHAGEVGPKPAIR